ncbi:MAG: hypothetical protein GKR97_20615 [Rhizobiaceae bacterium]|nr:hypothetical protein [Rhizobiaceae bacterium]
MNPFAMTNLLRPSIAMDHRQSHQSAAGSDMDYSMSRAAFRLIDAAGKFLAR